VEKRSRRRIAAVAATSWVLATAVTSFVVWRAVAVFNDGASTNILSGPQVSQRLQAATATLSAATSVSAPSDTTAPTPETSAPTSSSDDTSATTSPPSATATATRTASRSSAPETSAEPQPAATPVVKTWTVTGGAVSVSCQAQVISLVYASPQDGWRVETNQHGTDRIYINFQQVGQGTELKASCVNGVPQQTTQPTDGDH